MRDSPSFSSRRADRFRAGLPRSRAGRTPAKLPKRYGSRIPETDSFLLEQKPPDPIHRTIQTVGTPRSQADPTRGVDDAVPGHAASLRKRRESVADHPRVPRKARLAGDLAVCRHAAAGNAGDHGVNPGVAALRLQAAVASGRARRATSAIGRPMKNMCTSTPVIQTTGAGPLLRGGKFESGSTT